jgi:predicted kinase
MTESEHGRLPALIIVTGRPGAGKSTLAHALARALRCPVVSRDEIKEGLVRTAEETGAPVDDADLTRRASDAFFDVLALLVGRGVTVVGEAAFQHKVWAPMLEPLQRVASVRIVLCQLDAERARDRRVARSRSDPERERFHAEAKTPVDYDPPRLDVPTLRVDTSDDYNPAFNAIVDFAHG